MALQKQCTEIIVFIAIFKMTFIINDILLFIRLQLRSVNKNKLWCQNICQLFQILIEFNA